MVSLDDHNTLLKAKIEGGLTNHISIQNDLLFIWFVQNKKCLVMNVYRKVGGKYIRLRQMVNSQEETLVDHLQQNHKEYISTTQLSSSYNQRLYIHTNKAILQIKCKFYQDQQDVVDLEILHRIMNNRCTNGKIFVPGISFYDVEQANTFSLIHNDELVNIQYRTDIYNCRNYNDIRKEGEDLTFLGFDQEKHM